MTRIVWPPPDDNTNEPASTPLPNQQQAPPKRPRRLKPKPMIALIPGRLPSAIDDAEKVLVKRARTLKTFQRGGELVRIIRLPQIDPSGGLKRPAGTIQLEPVSTVALTDILGLNARFVKLDSKARPHPTDCPRDVAEFHLSRLGSWRIPVLSGTITAPLARNDGTIFSRPGYDARTGLFLTARSRIVIPSQPPREDAKKAINTLLAPFDEFPFVASADRSVFATAILTAIQRRILGPCPLFAFMAPTRGSGKSLLVDSISIIATGKVAPSMAVSSQQEEIRKVVLSALREGHQVINLDNIEHPLKSPYLSQVLTQEVYQDRVLGLSRTLSLPTNICWMATGNNLVFQGDLTRRVLLCSIDSGLERPEERTFSIPRLKDYISAHRIELLEAVLTILRAFHVAGCPKQDVTPYGGFEGWSEKIREPLIWIGLTDPCDTRESVITDDPDRQEVEAVFTAWFDTFKINRTTINEAINHAQPDNKLRRAFLTVAPGRDDGIDARVLGCWFRKAENKIVVGLKLVRVGESHHAAVWRIVPTQLQGTGSYTSFGELNSFAAQKISDEGALGEGNNSTDKGPEKTPQDSPNSPATAKAEKTEEGTF